MKIRANKNGYTLIELLITMTIIGILTSIAIINVQKINTDYTFDTYSLNLVNDIRTLQGKSVVNSNKTYSIILNTDGYILKENMAKLKEVKFKKNYALINKYGSGFNNQNLVFRYNGGINCSSQGITIYVKNINEKKYRKITIAAIGGRVKLYEKESNNLY